MISINSTENILKYATSIAFRGLIVLYSIFILLSQNNFFHPFIYITVIILYLYIYWQLLMKQKPISRTLNDYIYIFIILMGKDIFEFQNMILLLFPIINAPNHTQNKRQPGLLLLLSYSSFLILTFFDEKEVAISTYFYILISFFTLTLITYFEYYRSTTINKLLNIYNQIDQIISKKSSTSQLPEVYKMIVKKLNEDAKVNAFQIIGFQHQKNHWVIKNSSEFVHSYNIDNVINSFQDTKLIINKEIKINNHDYDSNIAIKLDKFIFLIITEDKVKELNILNIIKVYEILIPMFKKIINIIELENLLQKQKFKTLRSLRTKSKYVNTVMKSTHYLSNQFSPITNYFNLKEKYDSLPDSETELKSKMLILLNDEETRARVSINNITDRSLRILDKEESPFMPKTLKETKHKQIFMVIKNVWMQYFFENEIIIKNFNENNSETFALDLSTLEYICTDLFENVRKYSQNYHKIEFDFQHEIHITIINDIKSFEKNRADILEIVKNFNNDERIEINKRKGHGLSHAKESAHLLNMDIKLSIDEEKALFYTNLTFKKGK